uniref:Uncharacterized protein n=1 Tax=Candidatus Kentrum sp. LFY TaxID=2126342 RepID=A0A450WK14_9GAMM|nr:MAG: hypothetical protein BECKLFY1418C_GA0070996_103114 [Candidatus Kentron sp. LFY]
MNRLSGFSWATPSVSMISPNPLVIPSFPGNPCLPVCCRFGLQHHIARPRPKPNPVVVPGVWVLAFPCRDDEGGCFGRLCRNSALPSFRQGLPGPRCQGWQRLPVNFREITIGKTLRPSTNIHAVMSIVEEELHKKSKPPKNHQPCVFIAACAAWETAGGRNPPEGYPAPGIHNARRRESYSGSIASYKQTLLCGCTV